MIVDYRPPCFSMLSMLSMFNSRPARPKGFPHGIFLPAAVLLLLLVLVSATAPAASAEWANRPLVETRQGWLKGMADKQATWCWKGVPYAAPPVGDLRWKAPLDPAPWKGVRQARKFKSPASQTLPWIGEIGSEDCLYLNVWRPRNSSVGLPVYVFIHGGGNSIGTGTARDYSGCAVAGRSGMVYVTINFRLGVFGWFRHPAVTDAGSDEDRSGNFGTLDLIKALRWIRENIESFGGDPGNVTITGESGGAMDVLSLLTTPQASGLFHRAVVQSGLALTRSTAEAWQGASSLLLNILVADGKAKDLNEAARLSGTMSREEISAIFRAASPSSLMKSIPTIVGGMADWPMLLTDGTVIPAEGFGVFEKGSWANKVPLVIGVNRDEMKLFRFLLKNPEPGSRSYEILSRFQSLAWRVNGLDNIALAMTSHPDAPPVYAYRFDWGSADENGVSVLPGKLGSLLGANHYAEIPFFLGNGTNQLSILTGKSYTSANKPGREKLTTVTLNYLANFARTGNPNGDQLPYWDAWSSAPGRNKLIILDAGLKDLKISFSSEVITMKRIRETVISEFNEPERSWILRHLEGAAIFKQAAQ